ncbi:MAG: hypothetical protein AAF267_00320 [Deinococcota bacterium]
MFSHQRVHLLLSSMAVFLLLSACSGTSRVINLGILEMYSDFYNVQIDLPEAVARGQDFEVKVTTYAHTCRERARTDVTIQDMTAVITPYDYEVTYPDGTICNPVISSFEHTATLRFDQVGTATITVRGYSDVQEQAIDVVHIVTVQ